MSQVLVVTDLDNTFCSRGVVPEAHAQAVQQLAWQQIGVAAATARRDVSARRLLAAAGLQMPVISGNGSKVTTREGVVLSTSLFEHSAAQAIIETFYAHETDPLCFLGGPLEGVWSTRSRTEWFDWDDNDPLNQIVDIAGHKWGSTPDTLLGVATVLRDMEIAERLSDSLAALSSVTVLEGNSGDLFVDAVAPGVSKWSGIQTLVDDATFVIAVGDGGNDIAMLENADFSVTIEGSQAARMFEADATIAPPTRNGWCELVDIATSAMSTFRVPPKIW